MKTLEIISFLVFFAGFAIYIKYIHKNKEFPPNVIAFGIWFLADIIHLATYKEYSDFWPVPLLMAICAGIIFIMSLLRAKKQNLTIKSMLKNSDWIDWTSMSIVIISIGIWIFANDSIIANLVVQISLAMGFLPVIKSITIDNKNEPINFWSIFLLGFLILLTHTIIEYKQWEELIYPIIGFIGEGIVVSLIIHNYIKKKLVEIMP